MSLSEIDWANATWTEWLQVSVLGNPLAAWAVALLVTFVVASVLPVIKGFIETSFLDWRGLISAVLFLPGRL